MSRFIKHIALLVGFLSFSTFSMAQMSLAEMLRYGDQAFEQNNYASAIHFYKQNYWTSIAEWIVKYED